MLTELPAKRRQIVALEPESDEAREAVAREEQAIKAREAALEPLKEALELSKASDPQPRGLRKGAGERAPSRSIRP